MRESLHGLESGRLALLAHNVFDLFRQSRIVMVMEDGIVPASTDRKTVEFDIVLHDVLIILHLEIVNSIYLPRRRWGRWDQTESRGYG